MKKFSREVQSSTRKGYNKTMDTTWIKVPHHLHSYRSPCGTKFIDRDSRGWKLHTPKLEAWTYFPTLDAAKAAA